MNFLPPSPPGQQMPPGAQSSLEQWLQKNRSISGQGQTANPTDLVNGGAQPPGPTGRPGPSGLMIDGGPVPGADPMAAQRAQVAAAAQNATLMQDAMRGMPRQGPMGGPPMGGPSMGAPPMGMPTGGQPERRPLMNMQNPGARYAMAQGLRGRGG